MKEIIREALIKVASEGRTIYYSDLAEMVGVPQSAMGYPKSFYRTLTEIGTEEYENGRPLLNCLVISMTDRHPSIGFFKWYRDTVDISFDPYSTKRKLELFNKLKSDCFSRCSADMEA